MRNPRKSHCAKYLELASRNRLLGKYIVACQYVFGGTLYKTCTCYEKSQCHLDIVEPVRGSRQIRRRRGSLDNRVQHAERISNVAHLEPRSIIAYRRLLSVGLHGSDFLNKDIPWIVTRQTREREKKNDEKGEMSQKQQTRRKSRSKQTELVIWSLCRYGHTSRSMRPLREEVSCERLFWRHTLHAAPRSCIIHASSAAARALPLGVLPFPHGMRGAEREDICLASTWPTYTRMWQNNFHVFHCFWLPVYFQRTSRLLGPISPPLL